jgi:hypothetical protein
MLLSIRPWSSIMHPRGFMGVLSIRRMLEVVNFSDNYLTDRGVALLLDLVMNNTSMRELYLYRCCLVTPVGTALIGHAKEKLQYQCLGCRPHSLILWSVFQNKCFPPLEFFHHQLLAARELMMIR